jgi:hypothetical protein
MKRCNVNYISTITKEAFEPMQASKCPAPEAILLDKK